MPVCPNCDGEEFELVNGLYFCQVCNVQSQDVIEEDIDRAEGVVTRKLRKTKKKRKSTKSDHKEDRGKPWYTVEGFQAILKSQVDALIRLGCSPELRDVVKQIWFKFIHTNGIAVIDPTVKALRKPMEASTTFRDKFLSGQFGRKCLKHSVFPQHDKTFLKLRFASRTRIGKRRFQQVLSESDSDCNEPKKKIAKTKKFEIALNEDRPWRSDEEWFSLASDQKSSSSSDESVASSKSLPVSTADKSNNTNAHERKTYLLPSERHSASCLKLSSLLILLNIALQWCREPVTIGDLILWVNQGYLPYIDWFKSLLPHMKLTNFDLCSFNTVSIPSYRQISRETMTMIELLEFPETLPSVDVQQLVARYVIELNLPFSFCAFVECLVKKSDFTYKRCRKERAILDEIYQPDLVAISLLIISMKLMFGLDDEREWLLDTIASPCASHGEGCRAFSWKQWSGYHLKRWMDKRRNPRDCFEAIDPEAIEDVHPYVEHWKNVVLSAGLAQKQGKGNPFTYNKLETLRERVETKRWAFTKLCDLQGSSEEMERRKLQRQYPYVMPTPPEEDVMSSRCISHVIEALETKDFDYVWYSDSFSRMDNCFQRPSARASIMAKPNTFSHGEMNFYFSYDFLLSLAREVTASNKILVHTMVESLEKKLVCPYLTGRDYHKYSSTTWSQAAQADRNYK